MRSLLRALARRLATPPMIVALIALFVAVGGPAVADTGGNFILGEANLADHTTGLKSSVSGAPALDVENTGTSAGSVPLALDTSPGIPPFETNSTTRVTNLNADRLDGKNSTAFQSRVTGTCGNGSSVDQINSDGTVDCRRAPNLLEAGTFPGPIPHDFLTSIGVADEATLLVQFTATAFRPGGTGPGLTGVSLWVCETSPCTAGNAAYTIHATAYASKASFHLPITADGALILVPPGPYDIGVGLDPGTTSNSDDSIALSVVSFQP